MFSRSHKTETSKSPLQQLSTPTGWVHWVHVSQWAVGFPKAGAAQSHLPPTPHPRDDVPPRSGSVGVGGVEGEANAAAHCSRSASLGGSVGPSTNSIAGRGNGTLPIQQREGASRPSKADTPLQSSYLRAPPGRAGCFLPEISGLKKGAIWKLSPGKRTISGIPKGKGKKISKLFCSHWGETSTQVSLNHFAIRALLVGLKLTETPKSYTPPGQLSDI